MRAFEIYLNGKRLCVAGIGDSGVLSAIVNWVARENVGDLFMDVAGLVTPIHEHVSWIGQKRLRVGDKIQVRVIEATSVDKPKRKKPPNAAYLLRARKLYVRKMAKEFGWEIKSNAKKLSS